MLFHPYITISAVSGFRATLSTFLIAPEYNRSSSEKPLSVEDLCRGFFEGKHDLDYIAF